MAKMCVKDLPLRAKYRKTMSKAKRSYILPHPVEFGSVKLYVTVCSAFAGRDKANKRKTGRGARFLYCPGSLFWVGGQGCPRFLVVS